MAGTGKSYTYDQTKIDKYVSKGGSLKVLKPEEIKKVSAAAIKARADMGKSIKEFSVDQIKGLDQKYIDIYIAEGGSLEGGLPEDKLSAVGDDAWHKYFANGGDVKHLPEGKLDSTPREFWEQRVASGGSLDGLEKTNLDQLNSVHVSFWDERERLKRETAPEQPSADLSAFEHEREAVVLFGAGEMSSEELPSIAFAIDSYREALYDIVAQRQKQKFKDLCDAKGYKDKVPENIQKSFDDMMAKLKKEFEKRAAKGRKALKDAIKKGNKGDKKDKKTGKEIKHWGWGEE